MLRLNQLGYFDPIDKDKDAEFRTDDERDWWTSTCASSERGRQQISFNGGLSGIGGSFFGLDYSTNNLLGRGESLSFQFAVGNRQRSFLFSFTEPYIRDRPISVGFSLFAESRKFFGEGTFLSQNIDALTGRLRQPAGLAHGQRRESVHAEHGGHLALCQRAALGVLPPASRADGDRALHAHRPFLLDLADRSKIRPSTSRTTRTRSSRVVFRQPNILTSRITPSLRLRHAQRLD